MQIQYCTAHKNRAKLRRAQGALDKALDKWYNTGVGLNESITAAIKEHNDND